MAKVNPRRINGEWLEGFVLDLHTLKSEPIGTGPSGRTLFNTTYSEVGGLLNRLKYGGDKHAAPEIIEAAAAFWMPARAGIDLIVPVPASTYRAWQPVQLLASEIGAALKIPVIDCIRTTRPPAKLKDVSDPEKRKELLTGLYTVDAKVTTGKNVLLFDDLYRSGSTMNAITTALLAEGKASSVRAFAITCTRSIR